MKIRILAFGLSYAASLFGQYGHAHFSWQEACFKNSALPYCSGRDFAIKPTKGGKMAASGGSLAAPESSMDASGIDWRFADPSADALAVLTGTKLSASPIAHNLIDELGAKQGLPPTDVANIFRALSGVAQVALSVRDDRIVLLVTGRASDSVLPAPEAGWKAVPLTGKAILIGHADAVDQAAQRIATASPLGDLAAMALERPVESQFWAVESAKMAGRETGSAGVKVLSLAASMQDRFTSDTVFEFSEAPDVSKIQSWMSTLGNAKIEGNAVHARMSMEADDAGKSSGQIADSPFGQLLGTLVKSARYLPVRDTATTVHTKPVIFGLDDGPREAGQAARR